MNSAFAIAFASHQYCPDTSIPSVDLEVHDLLATICILDTAAQAFSAASVKLDLINKLMFGRCSLLNKVRRVVGSFGCFGQFFYAFHFLRSISNIQRSFNLGFNTQLMIISLTSASSPSAPSCRAYGTCLRCSSSWLLYLRPLRSKHFSFNDHHIAILFYDRTVVLLSPRLLLIQSSLALSLSIYRLYSMTWALTRQQDHGFFILRTREFSRCSKRLPCKLSGRRQIAQNGLGCKKRSENTF